MNCDWDATKNSVVFMRLTPSVAPRFRPLLIHAARRSSHAAPAFSAAGKQAIALARPLRPRLSKSGGKTLHLSPIPCTQALRAAAHNSQARAPIAESPALLPYQLATDHPHVLIPGRQRQSFVSICLQSGPTRKSRRKFKITPYSPWCHYRRDIRKIVRRSVAEIRSIQ